MGRSPLFCNPVQRKGLSDHYGRSSMGSMPVRYATGLRRPSVACGQGGPLALQQSVPAIRKRSCRIGHHKVTFRLRSYDPHMRSQIARVLPIAIFLALAVAFDYVGVAAISEAGFGGFQRLVLSLICLIVGTVSAFTLTRTLVQWLARR